MAALTDAAVQAAYAAALATEPPNPAADGTVPSRKAARAYKFAKDAWMKPLPAEVRKLIEESKGRDVVSKKNDVLVHREEANVLKAEALVSAEQLKAAKDALKQVRADAELEAFENYGGAKIKTVDSDDESSRPAKKKQGVDHAVRECSFCKEVGNPRACECEGHLWNNSADPEKKGHPILCENGNHSNGKPQLNMFQDCPMRIKINNQVGAGLIDQWIKDLGKFG